MSNNNPSVSVVVPAYNCEKIIAQVLQSIKNQDVLAEVEIVIVDDGSTDKTGDIVKSFSDVRYIRQENAGPAAARNRGFKETHGDIVFFTDSDCLPQKDWISTAMPHFAESNIAVVAGTYGIANENSWLARYIYLEIRYRHDKLLPIYPKSFGSYNFGIKRNVFQDLNGFNTTYRHASGEDNDLSYRLLNAGHKIFFERNSCVRHYHPVDLGKYFFEQFRHGFWRVKMYLDHPRMTVGDDYTFGKDIFEPAAVLLLLLFSFLGALDSNFMVFLILPLLCIMLFVEFYFAYQITKTFKDALVFGTIMFLRAFYRTLGFISAVPYFLAKKIIKKSK